MALSQEALEKKREYQRNWREKNREHVNSYMKQWVKKNPEKVRKNQERYWENKAKESFGGGEKE
jgi:hypothetical protein